MKLVDRTFYLFFVSYFYDVYIYIYNLLELEWSMIIKCHSRSIWKADHIFMTAAIMKMQMAVNVARFFFPNFLLFSPLLCVARALLGAIHYIYHSILKRGMCHYSIGDGDIKKNFFIKMDARKANTLPYFALPFSISIDWHVCLTSIYRDA